LYSKEKIFQRRRVNLRVFLFGVDGLTFRVLDPLMERGLLPNFQRVQEGGVHGILKSTTPPLTPPAWMSISTGMSPAKHGVYDFLGYEQTENGPLAHVMTHRRGGKALWNVLSEWGKRVIVANVPLTYPAEPVNGIMLSGHMAPDMKGNVTYPAAFKEELLQVVPEYQIDINPAVESGQIGDPLVETLRMTQRRIAMLHLLLDKPWDFFFIVFTGADRIQHVRWQEIMEFHPKAVAYYEALDKALGMVLEKISAEDMLIIVSDHGFKGIRRQFYMQEYLYKQGLLQVRNAYANRRKEFRNQVTELVRQLVWHMGLRGVPTLLRKQLYRFGLKTITTEHITARIPDLNWSKTHAWLQSVSGGIAAYADIFFDDTLSEDQISALIAALQKICDPETGQPLVTEVHREDVFGTGPFAPTERHLILISGENTTIRAELGMKNLWNTCMPYGIHHPDGILYLYGAEVKRGVEIAPAHVYDVVPTILSFMGLSLSKELDGRVIAEAFEKSLISPETYGESTVLRKLKKLTVE
jgi:predicted AlkP superfamily phosphohydrolase/phosphomutase